MTVLTDQWLRAALLLEYDASARLRLLNVEMAEALRRFADGNTCTYMYGPSGNQSCAQHGYDGVCPVALANELAQEMPF